MAIGDISLTSGMRANLQSLQNTSKLLDQTQRRLSTGNKVNSALDNPTNFFAAEAHTNRAKDLESLKDGMSEAIQVIKAADEGITSITSMIEAAQGLAQAAQTATNAYSTHTDITLTTDIAVGDQITINGVTFTAIDGSAGNSTATTFGIGSGTVSASVAASGLKTAIAASTTTLSAANVTTSSGVLTLSAAGSIEYFNVRESLDGASISYGGGAYARGERYDLAQQYNTLMSQLDDLVVDANYKGASTNLLSSSGELVVNFEGTHNLTVEGFDATTTGLGNVGTASSDWASFNDITDDLDKLDNALSILRTESASLASNLNVITTRQDFTENMINTLSDGADNLVLADMNEEGANMLMLQTRQSLATTSLSLSSQAAQSVLKLF
jgi:flagellin